MPTLHPVILEALAQRSEPERWVTAYARLLPYLSTVQLDAQKALIQHLQSPDQVTLLASLLARTQVSSAWSSELIDAVDHPSQPFNEWLPAFEALLQWQQQHRPDIPFTFPHALGFLGCCAEFQSSRTLYSPFSDLVTEMLEEHGIDD